MQHAGLAGPMIGLLVTMVNVGLLLALLVLFTQAYRRMRTPFGLGLLVFVVLLLVQNLLRVASALERFGRRDLPIAGPAAAVGSDLLELVALLVLLYLATR